ncbi:MAG: fibronectin type III domain-containing protein, partial [Salinispira sp.]
ALVVFWTGPSALWNATNGNADNGVSEYHLRYREEGRGSWKEITGISGLTYTITGLTNGITYEVQARAVNAKGNNDWTASAAETPIHVPDATDSPTLTMGNRQLTVKWIVPPDNGRPITAYHLRYSEEGSENWTPITSGISIRDVSYTITKLTPGKSYEVQVRAVNALGEGPWSSSATEIPFSDVPTELIVGNNRLIVEWAAPEIGGITGYELQYSSDDGTTWTLIEASEITGTYHIITGLTNGSTYEVQVRAIIGGVQEEDWSFSATATLLVPLVGKVPAGMVAYATLSDAIDDQIANENLTVSITTVKPNTVTRDGSGDITTVTPATTPGGVTIPTMDVGATGFIEVTASTTAGTYLVYGENGNSELRFAEYFYVTVSPQDSDGNNDGGNGELKTAVNTGISTWGNTGDLNYIITTAVTNMENMFKETSFNGDISGWDVSSVTTMRSMFRTTTVFNGDISGWDVSLVRDMTSMFQTSTVFAQDLDEWSDHWTVANGGINDMDDTDASNDRYTVIVTFMFLNSALDTDSSALTENTTEYPTWVKTILAY